MMEVKGSVCLESSRVLSRASSDEKWPQLNFGTGVCLSLSMVLLDSAGTCQLRGG